MEAETSEQSHRWREGFSSSQTPRKSASGRSGFDHRAPASPDAGPTSFLSLSNIGSATIGSQAANPVAHHRHVRVLRLDSVRAGRSDFRDLIAALAVIGDIRAQIVGERAPVGATFAPGRVELEPAAQHSRSAMFYIQISSGFAATLNPKLGGCLLQGLVVISLNEEALTERIVHAGERVCFVSPGLYDWVAEALVEVAGRIGRERVYVVIDPDPFVIQAGYGTEDALKKVHASGLIVHRAPRVRFGLVITDNRAAFFAPTALNIEEFPKDACSPNAVELSLQEANRIVEAVAPAMTRSEEESVETNRVPEIGQEPVSVADLQQIRAALEAAPPVAPDLARQMWVLNSQIQIVKIKFEGARLSQHRIQLKAEQLGIEDADLVRRITGSFKLFEADIDGLLAPLRADLERIKELYGLKPVGELGHVVLGKVRPKLENALNMFKNNLVRAQAELEQSLTEELDNSRRRLKKMLAYKIQGDEMSEASLERRLNYIISSMKFPAPDKVLSKIEFDWSILNITSQMIQKESFAQKIRDLYGKSIEELATIEQAVGVRGPAARLR